MNLRRRRGLLKGKSSHWTPQPERASVSSRDRFEPRWVTGSTLRKRLNISAATLWRWRQRADFPRAKRINRRLFFSWDDVEAWVEAQPDAEPLRIVPHGLGRRSAGRFKIQPPKRKTAVVGGTHND
jgi:predicted DNA-binding transcriptional regulator AlpA